jgi:aldose 1-epimerase
MASETSSVAVNVEPFEGGTDKGRKITVRNSCLAATFTNYGATLISLFAPDRSGKKEEVTLCYDTLDGIMSGTTFYGATIGRVGNRIAKGAFALNGAEYNLATNNGVNHLHGGLKGFDKVFWDFDLTATGVRFRYVSKDGEEGYPGELTTTVEFALEDTNKLVMKYQATVEWKSTPVNICNHAYWNLSGGFKRSIKCHNLELNCESYLPVDDTQIPTGQLVNVKNTPMAFPSGEKLKVGSRLNEVDGGGEPGYDHCYVVAVGSEGGGDDDVAFVARVEDEESGRRMEVHSTEPGVQLYTGNFLSKDTNEAPHVQHNALCLETQHFPDSINQKQFPPVILKPGDTFNSKTIHVFTTF